MKKVIKISLMTILVVILIATLSLMGCKTATPATTAAAAETTAAAATTAAATTAAAAETTAAAAPVTLEFYTLRTNEEAWVLPMIEKYKATHPNITINHHASERLRYIELISTAVAGGEAVDILETDGQFLRQLYAKNFLEDMSPYFDFTTGRLFQSAVNTATMEDGKIVAVPSSGMAVCGLYYNNAILKQYNLPVPKTWDDMAAINEGLKGTGISTFTYSAKDVWWMPMLLFLTLPNNTNAMPLETTIDTLYGKIKWNDPVYIQSFKDITDMVKNGWLSKSALGNDLDGAVQEFVQGKAATFYQGSWVVPTINTAAPEGFEYTFGAVPVKGDLKPCPAGGPGQCLAIAKSSSYKQEAADFINFLEEDENARFIVDAQGEFSANSAANEGTKLIETVNAKAIIDVLPLYTPFLDWYWEAEVTTSLQTTIQAALAGNETAESLGQKTQELYEQLKTEGKTYFWK